MTNHAALGCDQARQALSAHLDHEDPGVAPEQLQAHLDACPGCRDWLAHAEQLTRLVRVQPAQVPDLTDAILAAVAADQSAPPRPAATPATVPARARNGSLQRALQAAVAAIAAAQLFLAIPPILGYGFDIHTSHELGSFDATIAIGFMFAAFKPRLARPYTPIALVLAVCLATTSGWDIAHHHITVTHEVTGHLATVLEAGLLWALGHVTTQRTDRRTPPRPTTAHT